ncbi:hypothetical protein [Aurantiacibacter rhizosphaerae]|uniref:Phytoene synthase n=1 Tax=Aurantiacibacter rhizosphaerae TaxID=2691582 RepID=A0A844XDQ2_9SPHN|nr:hypothetical protein [Aurantiacibacter rhizosphaerae]MWV27960.1 hypothetical protein [Aurantiacibacter rhizosphaerae]
MSTDLIETLPLPQRLALSYAPRSAHAPTCAVLALDTRLAGIIRTGGEPVIAQMKLAWWRERLAQDPAQWPLGEPLLALLQQSGLDCAQLSPLVDGWEILLADSLNKDEIATFAQGRAKAWGAVADAASAAGSRAAVEQAGRTWALADLSLNLGTQEETARVRTAAHDEAAQQASLPAQLRPLAVLRGLAVRAMKRNAQELLDGPGAMALALRLGILGR